MKLEHNTEMFVTIKSSRQICRLHVLKWPLPFLSSLTALLPTITKGPRLFMIQVHYHAPMLENFIVSSQWPREMQAVSLLHLFPRVICSERILDCSHPCVSSYWFPMGRTQQPLPRQDFHSEFLQTLIKAEILVQSEEESGRTLVAPSKPKLT